MALRKTVRKNRRPKRNFRRKYGGYRKKMSTNVHKFTRFEAQETGAYRTVDCNFGATGWNGTAFTFDLSRLPNYTEFTALYDQYKITGVKINFDWSPDVTSSTGLEIYTPKLWLVRDYDDSTTPSLDELIQSTRVKCMRINVERSHSIFLKPAVLQQVYKSVVSYGNVPKWNQWIDCNDTTVPHYGLKLVSQGLPSTDCGKISCRVKYYLKCKNVR